MFKSPLYLRIPVFAKKSVLPQCLAPRHIWGCKMVQLTQKSTGIRIYGPKCPKTIRKDHFLKNQNWKIWEIWNSPKFQNSKTPKFIITKFENSTIPKIRNYKIRKLQDSKIPQFENSQTPKLQIPKFQIPKSISL